MNRLNKISALSLLVCVAAPTWAAKGDAQTQLDLSATVQREVANDQLDASLYVESQQGTPAALANELNSDSARATSAARAFPEVQVSSSAYSSWPQYDKKGQIIGWQGRAEIHLRSMNFVQSAELVAQLQQFMLLGGVDFSVSDATRKRVTQQMLPEAIKQLQDTAQVAATALGKSHVGVKALSIGNSAGERPMMAMMANRVAAAPSQDVATPDWQAGRSQLQLQVSGTMALY